MAETSMDSMELEAMRKEDSSWHPCRISLSSGDVNGGIIVDFGNDEEEDVICNKEDALSRLRFRSTPLHGDECANIKKGESVLVMQKTQSKSLFIDATIEKTKRVKHSKRVHCRCSFEIKWLDSELKGETETVPSKLILKLSGRSIDEHLVFSKFLNSLSSENGGEASSVLSFSEQSTCEAEFIGILEKQVEEISKLVDGSKAAFADLFTEVESANVAKSKSKTRQAVSRRNTRNWNKNELETDEKTDTEVKKKPEAKPVLTPLAARAALASLVHELPDKSIRLPGEQDFTKHKDSQLSDATGITVQSAIEMDPNPSERMKNHAKLETKNISPLNQWRAEGRRNSRDSLDASAIQEKKTKPSEEVNVDEEDEPDIILECSGNSVNGKKKKRATNMRLTRSALKESENTSLSMKKGASKVLRNTSKSARSTHSGTPKEVLVPSDVEKTPKLETPSFESQNVLSSDDDDAKEAASTKKLSGATNGIGSAKSTKQRKKLISNQVDSTSEPDSKAKKNEPATKKKTRSSHEDDILGPDAKDDETPPAVKKSRVFAKKDLTKAPLRSSPRLAVLPHAGS